MSDAYRQQEQERQLVERAIELSSDRALRAPPGPGGGAELLLAEIEQRKRARSTAIAWPLSGDNDGLWDWDVESGRVYYSPRWKAMLGHEEAEIGDGLNEWLDRVHPDDLPRVQADLDAHLRQENENLASEFRNRHRDGQYRWCCAGGIAVKDPERHTLRAAGSLTNVTDRKLAEEQLRFEAMHDSLAGPGQARPARGVHAGPTVWPATTAIPRVGSRCSTSTWTGWRG